MSGSAIQKETKLVEITVKTQLVLKSWRASVFSFEWLDREGRIRAHEDMPVCELEKRKMVEQRLENGETLEMPVLGIGMMDHIEIGSGKAVFMVLAARGEDQIKVLVSEKSRNDFSAFLA